MTFRTLYGYLHNPVLSFGTKIISQEIILTIKVLSSLPKYVLAGYLEEKITTVLPKPAGILAGNSLRKYELLVLVRNDTLRVL